MTQLYYYLKLGTCGMDQYGRWTDNPRAWQVYTDRQEALRMMEAYPGSSVGIL